MANIQLYEPDDATKKREGYARKGEGLAGTVRFVVMTDRHSTLLRRMTISTWTATRILRADQEVEDYNQVIPGDINIHKHASDLIWYARYQRPTQPEKATNQRHRFKDVDA